MVADDLWAIVQENVLSDCQVCENWHHKTVLYLGVLHDPSYHEFLSGICDFQGICIYLHKIQLN
jgi:hypothetical protein